MKTNPIRTQTNPILSRRCLWRTRIKHNYKKAKMNVTSYITKRYENNPPISAPKKRTQFSLTTKTNANLCAKKDYELLYDKKQIRNFRQITCLFDFLSLQIGVLQMHFSNKRMLLKQLMLLICLNFYFYFCYQSHRRKTFGIFVTLVLTDCRRPAWV